MSALCNSFAQNSPDSPFLGSHTNASAFREVPHSYVGTRVGSILSRAACVYRHRDRGWAPSLPTHHRI